MRHKPMFGRWLVLCLAILPGFLSCVSVADTHKDHQLKYTVTFKPEVSTALVSIEVPNNNWLTQISFNLKGRRLSDFDGTGKLQHKNTKNSTRLIWKPKAGENARLSYEVRIPEPRSSGAYSAYAAKDWLIMRAEDLIPPAKTKSKAGHKAQAVVTFVLPKRWTSVNMGYGRTDEGEHQFLLDESRNVPLPKGWVIAGRNLSTRHDFLGQTAISISGPANQNVKPTESLAFLGLTWAALHELAKPLPNKILLVSADDPMWRGGLSANNSLYIHASRPLVSENGTSTLLHELIHVTLGIRGAKKEDWIAEGIAEYYSVELLYRAGAYTPARRNVIMDDLKVWSDEVTCLKASTSRGARTAKATLVFDALDAELQKNTDGKKNLDDLVRRLKDNKKASLILLREHYQNITGKPSKVLNTPLMQCVKAQ